MEGREGNEILMGRRGRGWRKGCMHGGKTDEGNEGR